MSMVKPHRWHGGELRSTDEVSVGHEVIHPSLGTAGLHLRWAVRHHVERLLDMPLPQPRRDQKVSVVEVLDPMLHQPSYPGSLSPLGGRESHLHWSEDPVVEHPATLHDHQQGPLVQALLGCQ